MVAAVVEALVAARGRALGESLATLGVMGATLPLAAVLKHCHTLPKGIEKGDTGAGGSLEVRRFERKR